MSELLKAFEYDSNELRTVTDNQDQVWFVAKDVARILGYNLSNINDILNTHLDEDEKGRVPIPTLGGIQELWCVNESGMYALIFGSQKDKARGFRKWVTSVVLPSIRKTGTYSMKPIPDSSSKILDRYKEINALHEFRESIPEARRKLCDAIVFPEFNLPIPMRTSLLDREAFPEVAEDIDRFNTELATKKLLTATNLAAIYGVHSPQKMNKILANKGLQYRDAKTRIWLPTKLGLEHGKFLDKSILANTDNSIRIWRWLRSVIDIIN